MYVNCYRWVHILLFALEKNYLYLILYKFRNFDEYSYHQASCIFMTRMLQKHYLGYIFTKSGFYFKFVLNHKNRYWKNILAIHCPLIIHIFLLWVYRSKIVNHLQNQYKLFQFLHHSIWGIEKYQSINLRFKYKLISIILNILRLIAINF